MDLWTLFQKYKLSEISIRGEINHFINQKKILSYADGAAFPALRPDGNAP